MLGFKKKSLYKIMVTLAAFFLLYKVTIGYAPPKLYVLSGESKYMTENLGFHAYFSEAHGPYAYSARNIPEVPYEDGSISIKILGIVRECSIYAWNAEKDADGEIINENPVTIRCDHGEFIPIGQGNYNIYEIRITYLSGITATYGFKISMYP